MSGELSHTPALAGGSCTERAHAKVNLCLFVGARRPDGYHPVATVLQTLALHDDVHIAWHGFERADPAGARFAPTRIRVTSNDVTLPQDRENLAGRAVAALVPAINRRGLAGGHVEVFIAKRIPVAAGLGGGSADAAAVLRGLNRGLMLGLSEAEMIRIAATVGSDVPGCLVGGTVFCRGRGEWVTPVPAGRLWWVLAHPGGAGLSTGAVYAEFDRRLSEALRRDDLERPLGEQAPGLEEALRAGEAGRLAPYLANDLERPAMHLDPGLAALVARVRAVGAVAALVSGSGPTVAALAAGADAARELAERIRPGAAWVWWGPSFDPRADGGEDATWEGSNRCNSTATSR